MINDLERDPFLPLRWAEYEEEIVSGVRGFVVHFWCVSVLKCYSTTSENRVIEWSWLQSLPSQGVSLRGHERGG